MTDVAAPPTPSGAYRQFYPASVKIDGEKLITKARVVLADTGLYVYLQAPIDRGYDGSPVFVAQANYAAAAKPAVRVPNGYYLPLVDGRTATITTSGGCGCGNPLKRWMPTWSNNSLPWPA